MRHLLPRPILALALTECLVAQATIHVPTDQPTIQDAIIAASHGDTVLIAPGTYFEHDIDFLGKNVDVKSSAGAAATIVDAQSLGRCFVLQSGETASAVLSGLTLRNGRVPTGLLHGGGVYVVSASPRILDCVIEDCRASEGLSGSPFLLDGDQGGHGGGLATAGTSQVTIERCVFRRNVAGRGGDGSGALTPFGTGPGGGAGGPGGSGGAVAVLESSSAVIRDCLFESNRSGDGGSGGAGTAGQVFAPCVPFPGGSGSGGPGGPGGSSGSGGAIFGPLVAVAVSRCTFVSNGIGVAGPGGPGGDGQPPAPGAPACPDGFPGFPGAQGVGGAGHGAAIDSSIVSFNDAPQLVDVTVRYSNAPGPPAGPGNIDADPEFVDFAGGDYALSATSPCIDAGDGSVFQPSFTVDTPALSASAGGTASFHLVTTAGARDLDGRVRTHDKVAVPDTGIGNGPIVDMGAFEHAAWPPPYLYFMLGTLSGTSPGFAFGGHLVPLNFDAYLDLTLGSPNVAPLVDSFASLNGSGVGSPRLQLPAGSGALAGLTVSHACLVINPFLGGVHEVVGVAQVLFLP